MRNVVPKPVQKPHPPLWVACSRRETIHLAAQLGIGALTFAFIPPEETRLWVNDYYTTLERECQPIGQPHQREYRDSRDQRLRRARPQRGAGAQNGRGRDAVLRLRSTDSGLF